MWACITPIEKLNTGSWGRRLRLIKNGNRKKYLRETLWVHNLFLILLKKKKVKKLCLKVHFVISALTFKGLYALYDVGLLQRKDQRGERIVGEISGLWSKSAIIQPTIWAVFFFFLIFIFFCGTSGLYLSVRETEHRRHAAKGRTGRESNPQPLCEDYSLCIWATTMAFSLCQDYLI